MIAVVLAVLLAADVPTIWGDGVHDDTAGFEAMVCKQLFRYRPGALVETKRDGISDFELNGIYLLKKGIPYSATGPRIMLHGPATLRTDGALYEVDCASQPDKVS